MKASSRPFKATRYGVCPLKGTPDGCVSHGIYSGDLIVRLETPLVWHEEKVSQHNGKIYLARCTAQYVHDECLREHLERKRKENVTDDKRSTGTDETDAARAESASR